MKKSRTTETEAVRSLAALAQPQRLRAFRALVVAGPAGVTPGVLATELDIRPSALSFHLKELVHAGLAHSEPDGRHLVYRANFTQMDALLGYLTEHCCQGAACEVSPKRSKKAICADC